jgi:prepilin-type N-terminal cleavage/methylation domain-containing protein
MRKKLPTSNRRLPIEFGPEEPCPVPIRPAPIGYAHFIIQNSMLPGRPLNNFTFPPSDILAVRRLSVPAFSPSQCNGGASVPARRVSGIKSKTSNSKLRRRGFTLVEILVVLVLLSLIVFALMAVFSGTQRAFRASLTQTDTLEGGRAVMDLIANDLATVTPSYAISNAVVSGSQMTFFSPVNFYVNLKEFPSYPPSPFYQALIGSPDNIQRTNFLEDVFFLSKANIGGVPSWIGTGYSVNTNLADGTLYPLYRYYMATNAASGFNGQFFIFTNFLYMVYTNSSVWSHLMDGVVNLTVHTYDTNGVQMTNGYYGGFGFPSIPLQNMGFLGSGQGETSCYFYSNAVPASVEILMGTLEDHTLAHAEGLSGAAQSNYLAGASAQLHLFTRRVWIRNLDPSAYQ